MTQPENEGVLTQAASWRDMLSDVGQSLSDVGQSQRDKSCVIHSYEVPRAVGFIDRKQEGRAAGWGTGGQ